MELDEALKLLKNAGFICEDTETQDDEHNEILRNSNVGDFKSLKKIVDLENKHQDLMDKIKNARKFNNSGFNCETYFNDVRDLVKNQTRS